MSIYQAAWHAVLMFLGVQQHSMTADSEHIIYVEAVIASVIVCK